MKEIICRGARPILRTAVSHVNVHGALLVFPIKNNPEPNSLWKCYYPRTPMRWEWDSNGDNRVPTIWHLREELLRSRKVVYTKWYQGRATLFSFPLFSALLSHISKLPAPDAGLSSAASELLKVLEDDSPLPTKKLRAYTELTGKLNEGKFNKGMRELSSRLLVVGYGEVEEGGFPSLAMGATKLLFEDLWDASQELSEKERDKTIGKYLVNDSPFRKQYKRMLASLREPQS